MLFAAFAPRVHGQSADLVNSYKEFETAKSQHKVADALKYGNEAVRLTEQSGDKLQLGELLRDIGDYAAQENKDAEALGYYDRALALQQDQLGAVLACGVGVVDHDGVTGGERLLHRPLDSQQCAHSKTAHRRICYAARP